MKALCSAVVALALRDKADLTIRQFATFLLCYVDTGPHSVGGLASELHVADAVVSRSLEKLALFDLVRRGTNPKDRRSVLAMRTAVGREFMHDLRTAMGKSAIV
jgi:DNA-binding MarR family transcriptional regulator